MKETKKSIENKTVFDTPSGPWFICHRENLSVDDLLVIGRELGVVE